MFNVSALLLDNALFKDPEAIPSVARGPSLVESCHAK